jgi:hypothetical protein
MRAIYDCVYDLHALKPTLGRIHQPRFANRSLIRRLLFVFTRNDLFRRSPRRLCCDGETLIAHGTHDEAVGLEPDWTAARVRRREHQLDRNACCSGRTDVIAADIASIRTHIAGKSTTAASLLPAFLPLEQCWNAQDISFAVSAFQVVAGWMIVAPGFAHELRGGMVGLCNTALRVTNINMRGLQLRPLSPIFSALPG